MSIRQQHQQHQQQLSNLLKANGINKSSYSIAAQKTLKADYKLFKNGTVTGINSMQSSILLYINDIGCPTLEAIACNTLNNAYQQLATPTLQVSTHQRRKA
jgi:hypothetical protein